MGELSSELAERFRHLSERSDQIVSNSDPPASGLADNNNSTESLVAAGSVMSSSSPSRSSLSSGPSTPCSSPPRSNGHNNTANLNNSGISDPPGTAMKTTSPARVAERYTAMINQVSTPSRGTTATAATPSKVSASPSSSTSTSVPPNTDDVVEDDQDDDNDDHQVEDDHHHLDGESVSVTSTDVGGTGSVISVTSSTTTATKNAVKSLAHLRKVRQMRNKRQNEQQQQQQQPQDQRPQDNDEEVESVENDVKQDNDEEVESVENDVNMNVEAAEVVHEPETSLKGTDLVSEPERDGLDDNDHDDNKIGKPAPMVPMESQSNIEPDALLEETADEVMKTEFGNGNDHDNVPSTNHHSTSGFQEEEQKIVSPQSDTKPVEDSSGGKTFKLKTIADLKNSHSSDGDDSNEFILSEKDNVPLQPGGVSLQGISSVLATPQRDTSSSCVEDTPESSNVSKPQIRSTTSAFHAMANSTIGGKPLGLKARKYNDDDDDEMDNNDLPRAHGASSFYNRPNADVPPPSPNKPTIGAAYFDEKKEEHDHSDNDLDSKSTFESGYSTPSQASGWLPQQYQPDYEEQEDRSQASVGSDKDGRTPMRKGKRATKKKKRSVDRDDPDPVGLAVSMAFDHIIGYSGDTDDQDNRSRRSRGSRGGTRDDDSSVGSSSNIISEMHDVFLQAFGCAMSKGGSSSAVYDDDTLDTDTFSGVGGTTARFVRHNRSYSDQSNSLITDPSIGVSTSEKQSQGAFEDDTTSSELADFSKRTRRGTSQDFGQSSSKFNRDYSDRPPLAPKRSPGNGRSKASSVRGSNASVTSSPMYSQDFFDDEKNAVNLLSDADRLFSGEELFKAANDKVDALVASIQGLLGSVTQEDAKSNSPEDESKMSTVDTARASTTHTAGENSVGTDQSEGLAALRKDLEQAVEAVDIEEELGMPVEELFPILKEAEPQLEEKPEPETSTAVADPMPDPLADSHEIPDMSPLSVLKQAKKEALMKSLASYSSRKVEEGPVVGSDADEEHVPFVEKESKDIPVPSTSQTHATAAASSSQNSVVASESLTSLKQQRRDNSASSTQVHTVKPATPVPKPQREVSSKGNKSYVDAKKKKTKFAGLRSLLRPFRKRKEVNEAPPQKVALQSTKKKNAPAQGVKPEMTPKVSVTKQQGAIMKPSSSPAADLPKVDHPAKEIRTPERTPETQERDQGKDPSTVELRGVFGKHEVLDEWTQLDEKWTSFESQNPLHASPNALPSMEDEEDNILHTLSENQSDVGTHHNMSRKLAFDKSFETFNLTSDANPQILASGETDAVAFRSVLDTSTEQVVVSAPTSAVLDRSDVMSESPSNAAEFLGDVVDPVVRPSPLAFESVYDESNEGIVVTAPEKSDVTENNSIAANDRMKEWKTPERQAVRTHDQYTEPPSVDWELVLTRSKSNEAMEVKAGFGSPHEKIGGASQSSPQHVALFPPATDDTQCSF